MNNELIKTLTSGLMHGLKFKYCCPYDHNSDRIGIVNEVDMISKCFCDETGSRYKFGHPTVKLFLFPMSSLTKEIEFKGERFVPIGRIYKKYKYTISEKTIELILENEDLFICPYGIIEWLIEHHFNVFGLSPEEFIEVTEDNNPYK